MRRLQMLTNISPPIVSVFLGRLQRVYVESGFVFGDDGRQKCTIWVLMHDLANQKLY